MICYRHWAVPERDIWDRTVNQSIPGLNLHIGKRFDAYDFTKKCELSFEQALDRRLKSIRSRYDYVRVWYSGGQDSGIIIKHCLDADIFLDEICMVEMCLMPNDPGGREITESALPWAQKYKNKYPSCYINHWRLTPEMLSEQPLDVMRGIRIGDQRFPSRDLYNVLNPLHKVVTQPNNYCDVMGFVAPNIDIKNRRFRFVDSTFNSIYQSIEHLSPSDDCPELIHAWIQTVVPHYTGDYINGGDRDTRKHLSIFQQSGGTYNYPKDPSLFGPALTEHGVWGELRKFEGYKDHLRLKYWLETPKLADKALRWMAWADGVRCENDRTGIVTKWYSF